MSIHIGAPKGDIAETVLLPGDPLRAKFIAENMLEGAVCYNNVRGMLGFTGTYKGKKISVQGTGMGVPSILIYATELIEFYGAKNLIRIGTCGSIKEDIKIRDIILATTASTRSAISSTVFGSATYAPSTSFDLLRKAYDNAAKKGIHVHVGSVFTEDQFYNEIDDSKLWASYGMLAKEMETYGLYTVASRNNVNALSILTVSDSLVTGELTSSEEREKTFTNMVEIALDTAID
ncbi:MAG: purine-nucleoside phosphorylase [Clostridiales bacterium]|nr:purine-nucleoside phosphorylase [Clostridiales bacterium]